MLIVEGIEDGLTSWLKGIYCGRHSQSKNPQFFLNPNPLEITLTMKGHKVAFVDLKWWLYRSNYSHSLECAGGTMFHPAVKINPRWLNQPLY